MMREKKLYKGTFNWRGETMILHGRFMSEEHAFFTFTTRVAKKVEVHRRTVYYYFSSQARDDHLIERVKE